MVKTKIHSSFVFIVVCVFITMLYVYEKNIKVVIPNVIHENQTIRTSVLWNDKKFIVENKIPEALKLKKKNLYFVIPYQGSGKDYKRFRKYIKENDRQNWNITVYIIKQITSNLYRYGWLMNIGIMQAISNGGADCIITHDANILVNKNANYGLCEEPSEICSQFICGGNIISSSLLGNVITAKPADWQKINGFSNKIINIEEQYKDVLNRFQTNHLLRLNGKFRPANKSGSCECFYEKDVRTDKSDSIIQSQKENLKEKYDDWNRDGLNSAKYHSLERVQDEYENIWIKVSENECTGLQFGNRCVQITTPTFRKQLFVGVLSAHDNFEKRQSIRKTWKNFNGDWELGFLIGLPFGEKSSRENITYGDLILVHEDDRYFGISSILPVKTASIYWIASKFKPEWVLKTDDDSFVDISKLINMTRKLTKPFYGGHILRKTRPVRNQKSISYVSKEQWQNDIFPDYASGAGYIVSGNLMECFNRNVYTAFEMPREDVFSGVLAQKCNIKPQQVKGLTDFALPRTLAENAIIQHLVKTNEHMNRLWTQKKAKNSNK